MYFARSIYTCNLHEDGALRRQAAKQTVSVTLNSGLFAQARRFGINTSQMVEEALAQEVARRNAERLREEVRKGRFSSQSILDAHDEN